MEERKNNFVQVREEKREIDEGVVFFLAVEYSSLVATETGNYSVWMFIIKRCEDIEYHKLLLRF